MKFSCDGCDKRYQIPDEKVAGRRLRYTCRNCQAVIVLDGTAIVAPGGPSEESRVTSDNVAAGFPRSIPPSAAPSSLAFLEGAAGPTGGAVDSPAPAAVPVTPPARASVPPARVSVPPPRASTPPSSAPAPTPAQPAPKPAAPSPIRSVAMSAGAPLPKPANAPVPRTAGAPLPKPASVTLPKPPAAIGALARPAQPARAATPSDAAEPQATPIATTSSSDPARSIDAPDSSSLEKAETAERTSDTDTAAIGVPVPAGRATPTPDAPLPPPLPRVLPDAPPALPELPIWHVAIRGTPVGPLRRSEIAARIDAGDVNARSLAWCDGRADWAPIATIDELSSLVTPAVVEPKPTRPSVAPEPAPVGATTPTPLPEPIAPNPARDSVAPSIDAGAENDEAEGGAAAAALDPDASPSAPPTPVTDDALPVPRASSPLAKRLAIAGAIAIAAVGAYMLGKRSSDPVEPPRSGTIASGTSATPQSGAPDPSAANSALSTDSIEDVGDDGYLAELAGVVDAGTRDRAAARVDTARADARDDAPLPLPVAGGSTPTQVQASNTTGSGSDFEAHATTSRSAASGPLEAAQISSVVRANRTRAQRCYERAATISGSAPDVRLSVTIRIAPGGNVSNVDVTGNDFGGVISCVERVVSSWQFPASTTGGQTTFSLVFAGS